MRRLRIAGALAGALGVVACGPDAVSGPPAPSGALRFAELAAGYYHTCGLTHAGTAWCWGRNFVGTLGDGTRESRLRPTAVTGTPRFEHLDAGAGHNCALTAAGVAWCWGQNDEGQVGDGTFTIREEPVRVAGGQTFTAIRAGHAHSCALTASGTAWCWGDDTNGQLGNGLGGATKSAAPVQVSGSLSFTHIYAGYYQSCGLTAGGKAYCWGLNDAGQNGDGSTENRYVPAEVGGGRTFTRLATGDRFVCGISGGAAWCWGGNRSGELGPGLAGGSTTPVLIAGTSGSSGVFASIGASTISSAQPYACALRSGSRVYCWGGAVRSLRAARTDVVPLGDGISAATVAAGADHICVLSGGYAFCGGGNYGGQLGDGTTTDRTQLTGVVRP